VRVEEIDDRGKISLVPAGEIEIPEGAESAAPERSSRSREDRPREDRPRREAPKSEDSGDIEVVSFTDTFDAELSAELGDLGPAGESRPDRGDRGDSRGRRRHR
jgi:hypothetical protein